MLFDCEDRLMRSVTASADHERIRLRLLSVLKTDGADLPADEILAVVAHLTGQLVAMQDQRRFTPDAVMTLVSQNIEAGNRHAIEFLLGKTEGHG